MGKVEDYRFQSTPVIANGRIPNQAAAATSLAGFNPRPLLLTGESRFRSVTGSPPLMFQSTPVIANGRIDFAAAAAAAGRLFQSTPVIANGRISGQSRAT